MLRPMTNGRELLNKSTSKLAFKKFRIVLIKPSKYDDHGYVIRFWKGVLPSNTLNVLHGLTEDVKSSGVFGNVRIEIVTFDETAEKLPVNKIIRWSRRPTRKLVVGLVGVQTNQFPRAFDLARQFRAAGTDVIIGGNGRVYNPDCSKCGSILVTTRSLSAAGSMRCFVFSGASGWGAGYRNGRSPIRDYGIVCRPSTGLFMPSSTR